MGRVLLLFLLTFVLLSGSCSKQAPGTIESDYVDATQDLERNEACQKLNLTKDIFQLENTRSLFKCATWDKEFPKIYNALNGISSEDWDYYAKPFDELFYNNKTKRNQLISRFKSLDEEDGLDELSKVITSLSDSNFFKHIHEVFECAEDDETCQEGVFLTKNDLWNFFRFFLVDKEEVQALSNSSDALVRILSETDNAFVKSLESALSDSGFVDARYMLIDYLVLSLEDKNVGKNIRMLKSLLEEEVNGEFYFTKLFNKDLNQAEFLYLVNYPVVEAKNQWKDFRLIDDLLVSDLVCKGFVNSKDVVVNVSAHVNEFINTLFVSDRENYFEKSIESIAILKTAAQMCPEMAVYKKEIYNPLLYTDFEHELVYLKTLSSTTKLLIYPAYYDFFKKIYDHVEKESEGLIYLISLFSSDLYVSSINLLQSLHEQESNMLAITYEMLKRLEHKNIESLIVLVNWLEKKDNYLSLVKVWNSLSKEGRMFIFNFLDSHFKNDADVKLLFKFYATLLDDFSSDIVTLLFTYFDNEKDKNTALKAMKNIAKSFESDELKPEFKAFFSRDHFLEILEIMSRGAVQTQEDSLVIDKKDVFPPQLVSLSDATSLITSHEQMSCFQKMGHEENDFYVLASRIPDECKEYVDKNLYLKLISEVGSFGEYLSGEGQTWNGVGVLSPEMLKSGVLLIEFISNEFASAEVDGVTDLFKDMNEFFDNSERKEHYSNAFDMYEYLKGEESFFHSFTSFYADEANFKSIGKWTSVLTETLKLSEKYHKKEYDSVLMPTSWERDESYKCSEYQNIEIGGKVCPNKEELLYGIKQLIEYVLRDNNENEVNALHLLLSALMPSEGLRIPFKEVTTTMKNLTISETLSFLYDTTNSNLETNHFELEYQRIPEADKVYFEGVEDSISRDMYDKDVEEKVHDVNTLERIEVVIRDVRFDSNYLGAHYMNSVAKAISYDETVDSKQSLLNLCVPLKFCGKFMNRPEHRLGRNSKRAFSGLVDVNIKEKWNYGDYMKALLQVIVASSADNTQVSTIINKKVFGVDVAIPVLLSKSALEKHNGKILTVLSMMGAFTNGSRLIRDRLFKTDEEKEKILNSDRLKRIDEKLFAGASLLEVKKIATQLMETLYQTGWLKGS